MTSTAETRPRQAHARTSSAAVDDVLVAPPRRALHLARLRGVAAEGERGEGLRAEVDGQDLHRGERQRQRAARGREGEERDDLGGGVGEDVEDELADVRVDAAALLDGADDAREVVVGEDHRGALARDVGARAAHGDADVGPPQRRRVVDAVAGHRHHVALGAQGVGDPQLRLRRGAGEDELLALAQQPVEVGSDIASSSAPVTTRGSAPPMPTWRAIGRRREP